MDHVTAQSLQKNLKKLHDIHQNTYEVLFKNALTFIGMQSALGAQECFHTVPMVLPGHALFPYNQAVVFIMESLAKRGFHVKRHSHQIIHVSWICSDQETANVECGGSAKRKLPRKYTAFLKKK